MIENMFDSVQYLEKGLDASWLRNKVIANNIANVDTPNFKASKVEFESLFKSALEDQEFSGPGGADTELDRVSPVVVQNSDTTMRMDGNNVDIDYENAEMAKNSLYYDTLVQKISSEFAKLNLAINEGK